MCVCERERAGGERKAVEFIFMGSQRFVRKLCLGVKPGCERLAHKRICTDFNQRGLKKNIQELELIQTLATKEDRCTLWAPALHPGFPCLILIFLRDLPTHTGRFIQRSPLKHKLTDSPAFPLRAYRPPYLFLLQLITLHVDLF